MKKITKILLTIFISFLVLVAILFFSIPKILQTKPFKDYFVKRIEERLNGKIEIKDLELSWFGPQVIQKMTFTNNEMDVSFRYFLADISIFKLVSNMGIDTNVVTNPVEIEVEDANIKIHYPNLPNAEFYDVDINIKTQGFNKPMVIDIKGKSKDNNIVGEFSIQGTIATSGKPFYDIKANFKNIPVIVLDRILSDNKSFGTLTQLLGPKMNLTLVAKIEDGNGPVDIDLSSTNMQAFAKLKCLKNALYLREPFIATLTMRPIPEEYYNKGFTPLFEGIYSKKPMVLRIADDNFYLPINPLNFKKMNIDYGMLDMGLITTTNKKIINALKSLTKSTPSQMDLWFGPVDFSFHKEKLLSNRLDALIDYRLHICTWGDIDFNKEYVDMNLGLTASALYIAYGVGGLPDDYVLKIPMRGPFNNVQIDTGNCYGQNWQHDCSTNSGGSSRSTWRYYW